MKLLIAGGGTGGHVIPALVIAREFCRRDPSRQVLFVGTSRGIENRLVPAAGFPLELIEIGALQGQSLSRRLRTAGSLPAAVWKGMNLLGRFQPDVVLGVGGYASGPILLAAVLRRVPLTVFVPDAIPGLANRWVARYVKRAFVAFEEARSYFPKDAALVTGIPVRPEFFDVPPARHRPPHTVLVFGGSQGARTLNRAVLDALPSLAHGDPNAPGGLTLIHQTGQSEYNRVQEEAGKHGVPVEVSAFLDRMWEAFARADLVVCRAGAATIAELAAAGRAAIFVPLPTAANEHQLRNAEAMRQAGAARLILDRDLNGKTLLAAIRELLSAPEQLSQMETAARHHARSDAAVCIVDELEKLGVGSRE